MDTAHGSSNLHNTGTLSQSYPGFQLLTQHPQPKAQTNTPATTALVDAPSPPTGRTHQTYPTRYQMTGNTGQFKIPKTAASKPTNGQATRCVHYTALLRSLH
ncbi:hypothetical protein ACOMHN_047427 [Nucella lapillus]